MANNTANLLLPIGRDHTAHRRPRAKSQAWRKVHLKDFNFTGMLLRSAGGSHDREWQNC